MNPTQSYADTLVNAEPPVDPEPTKTEREPVITGLASLELIINDQLPEGHYVTSGIGENGWIVLQPSGFVVNDDGSFGPERYEYDPDALVRVEFEVDEVEVDDFCITGDQIDEILMSHGMSDYIAEGVREVLMYSEHPIDIEAVSDARCYEDVMVTVQTEVAGTARMPAGYLVNDEEFDTEDEFREALQTGATIALSQEFGVDDRDVRVLAVHVEDDS